MLNDGPIILAEWVAKVNTETRRMMGVATGPELAEYSPPPDAKARVGKWAQSYLSELDYLMSDVETAVCVAADVARVRELCGEPEAADGWVLREDLRGDREVWATAAREYHAKRGNKVSRVEYTPAELALYRVLLLDEVALDRAWRELQPSGRAAESMVDALVFALRRGLDALKRPDNRRRLRELNDAQLHEVAARVQAFMPHIAPAWPSADMAALISMWSKLQC